MNHILLIHLNNQTRNHLERISYLFQVVFYITHKQRARWQKDEEQN